MQGCIVSRNPSSLRTSFASFFLLSGQTARPPARAKSLPKLKHIWACCSWCAADDRLRDPTCGHCYTLVRQFLSGGSGRTDHRGAFLSCTAVSQQSGVPRVVGRVRRGLSGIIAYACAQQRCWAQSQRRALARQRRVRVSAPLASRTQDQGPALDRKDKLAAIPITTITALSDALYTILQQYAYAPLQSLTSFAYFVHAVETAQKALYGSLSIRNHITG